MDKEVFTIRAPGRITPIVTEWGNDSSFTPDPLPPSRWDFDNSLWPFLSEAKFQIGILEGLGRVLPDPALLLRPITDREAISSSAIEGTYATARELLLFDLGLTDRPGDRADEWREVHNYRRAIERGIAGDLPVSLRLIRDLHGVLMTGVRGKDSTPGRFRTLPVGIGGGRFIPPPPTAVPDLLSDLEQYIHSRSPHPDPLVDCFLVHYQFETIHPFRDGNGRVGRLLLAIMLQSAGQMSKPWLYMSEFFEGNRNEYCERLFQVSANGDWTEWLKFCLRGLTSQAKATILRCERLRAIRERYLELIRTHPRLPARLNEIVEQIFRQPFIEVTSLKSLLDVSYPTAKKDADRLVDLGILRDLPDFSPRTLYAPDVYEVAYAEFDTKRDSAD